MVLERAKAENDCFLLPDAGNVFNAWQPNDQEAFSGEKTLIMVKPLHFYGPLPQSLTVKGANQVFDYSRMMGRFFEPDDRLCIIIDNSSYDQLR